MFNSFNIYNRKQRILKKCAFLFNILLTSTMKKKYCFLIRNETLATELDYVYSLTVPYINFLSLKSVIPMRRIVVLVRTNVFLQFLIHKSMWKRSKKMNEWTWERYICLCMFVPSGIGWFLYWLNFYFSRASLAGY